MKILCSTGALIGMPNKRNYRLIKGLSEKLSCDGFEFMMYDTWYGEVEELTRYLLDCGISIPVMHCEKHIGERISQGEPGDFEEAMRRFSINCEMAGRLGADRIVVHLWDGLTSDRYFERNKAAYKTMQEIAAAKGVALLVENVVCNGEDPLKHWCELVETYQNIQFVFDTKMAAFHDQLEDLYEEKYSFLWRDGHIRHYHVNDYAGGYKEWDKLRTLPIGKGKIDFTEFFDFIKKTGYRDTFTVEATAFDREGYVDTDMLNRCFSDIRSYLCG